VFAPLGIHGHHDLRLFLSHNVSPIALKCLLLGSLLVVHLALAVLLRLLLHGLAGCRNLLALLAANLHIAAIMLAGQHLFNRHLILLCLKIKRPEPKFESAPHPNAGGVNLIEYSRAYPMGFVTTNFRRRLFLTGTGGKRSIRTLLIWKTEAQSGRSQFIQRGC